MKKILLVLSVLVLASSMSFAGDSTPIRLHIVPPLSVPAKDTVGGIDLGWLAAKTKNVTGIQYSIFSSVAPETMWGYQSALVCVGNNDVRGLQNGFVNRAGNMQGIQWGFVNIAKTLKGVQIGLLNIIRSQSPVPVMVLINANF